MQTVGIIYGGKSSEHEVSLVSATSVVRNINREKFNIILIGISKKGKWFVQQEDELNRILTDSNSTLKVNEDSNCELFIIPGGKNKGFISKEKEIFIDVIFPVVHGGYCEDGTLQGLLDTVDIPYVGCGCMSSALTMDKEKTKVIWNDAGLPIVPYMLITRTELNDSKKYDEFFKSAIDKIGFPLFVKPCNAGSSVGASKATNEREFSMALMEAFMWDNKVLVEKSINAREVECSVTGNSTCESLESSESIVKAYTLGEILPAHDFYDYEAKYKDPDGAKLQIPANLTAEETSNIQQIAIKAYRAVDASGLSRVDFFIDKDDGKIYLNEINTLPGFTSISMFPKLCDASGLKYSDLIELLLKEAIARYNSKEQLQTSI